jgi:hypothetical protein
MKRILSAALSILISSTAFAGLYTPGEALTETLSEPLSFVGYYMPKYSESQKYPNCLFKNSKVLVMTSYCVRGKVPAGSVRIHSVDPTRGYVRIYSEMNDMSRDISTASRSDYVDLLFSTSARITQQSFDPEMDAKTYEKWEERENKKYSHYCVTSGQFPNEPYRTICTDLTNELHVWGPKGLEFWENSDPNWPKLLKKIKAQVKTLPNYPY